MRKTDDGSKMARGKKKRRNCRKQMMRKPPNAAQVMRRRALLIGGSGGASTSAPAAFAARPFGTPFATLAVGVAPALAAAPGATRAAAGVPAGVSVLGAGGAGSAVGVLSTTGVFPLFSLSKRDLRVSTRLGGSTYRTSQLRAPNRLMCSRETDGRRLPC